MRLKIFAWLRERAKPLGFNEYLPGLLSESEMRKFQLDCRTKMDAQIGNPWFDIFEWHFYYGALDLALLQEYKRRHLISFLGYCFSRLLRALYLVGDIARILFPSRRTYYLSLKKTGALESDKALLIYSKNKVREQLFDLSKTHKVLDYLITLQPVTGYEYVSETRLTLLDRVNILKLKLRCITVSVEIIFEVHVAQRLLKAAFAEVVFRHKDLLALVREGGTPLQRIFLKVAKSMGIDGINIFTGSIINEWTSVPPDVDKVVVNSRAGILNYKCLRGRPIVELLANPYLRWQEIAKSSVESAPIGFIVGDDIYRYREQEMLDRSLLDAMARLGVKRCLMRPHPQEMTRPSRVKYYQDLINRYSFLELSTDERADAFLQKVGIIVSYVRSTILEDALLCKRQVLLYRRDLDEFPSKEIMEMASGLGRYCSSFDEFGALLKELSMRTSDELNADWLNFVKRLGFESTNEILMDTLLAKVSS